MGVQGAGGLHQHQDGCLGGQGPGQGHALALPAGEVAPPLSQGAVHRSQGVHDVVAHGGLQGGTDRRALSGAQGGTGDGVLAVLVPARLLGQEGGETGRLGRLRAGAQDRLAQAPGEELGVGGADHDGAPHCVHRDAPQVHPAQGHGARGVVAAPQALGEVGRQGGVGAHQSGQAPTGQGHPGDLVAQVPQRVEHGHRVGEARVGHQGPDRQQASHLAGPHPGAGGDDNEVHGHVEGVHQVGGEPVEGDELAHAQAPGDDLEGARPHHDGGEEGGETGLEPLQEGLGAGHPDPGVAHGRGLGGVAARVDVLPANAPQDAQAGDGVGGNGGQPALLLTLKGPAGVDGPADPGQERQAGRQAQEDQQTQSQVGTQHNDRHHGHGAQRRGQGDQAVDQGADVVSVVVDGSDHVPGRDLGGDGPPARADPVRGRARRGHVPGPPGGDLGGLDRGGGQGVEQGQPYQGRQRGRQVGPQPPLQPGVQEVAQGQGDEGPAQVAQAGGQCRGHHAAR